MKRIGYTTRNTIDPDQRAALEMMLEDFGASRVLEELADACADRARWLQGIAPITYAPHARLLDKQAAAIRALSTSYAIEGE